MIKAVFWDNDGVLADTEVLYFKATQRVLEDVGIVFSKDQYARICLEQGRSAFECVSHFSGPVIQKLRVKRNKLYSHYLSLNNTILDGVRETFDELGQHFLMGIVTSSSTDHFNLIHRSSDFLTNVNFILTRESYQYAKPHPEPYLLALERSGLLPDECVVIEDSERGLKSALSAGIRCFIIPNDLTRNGDFTGAYKVLQHVLELKSEILSLS
ncbi:MAG: HAD family phosphatase [Chlamydiota bacterium]|nr:HAD family phosphatase [Chlamydiota bacterium]